jgi:hypothetical protein
MVSFQDKNILTKSELIQSITLNIYKECKEKLSLMSPTDSMGPTITPFGGSSAPRRNAPQPSNQMITSQMLSQALNAAGTMGQAPSTGTMNEMISRTFNLSKNKPRVKLRNTPSG